MPKMVKYVIGNKSDVENRRVPIKEGRRYASQNQMPFFETSALINDGSINDVFSQLATDIKKTFDESELTTV
jgi:hypothetical protein